MQQSLNNGANQFADAAFVPAAQNAPTQYAAQAMQNQAMANPHVGGQQYQRLEHRDQIRLRPDTYIGSPTGVTSEPIWTAKILGEGTIRVEHLTVQVSAAIIGISKEVFDNATDNVERSVMEGIDPGNIQVAMSNDSVTVRNHGKHIPVVIHHVEKIWTPQMLFGVLLTSDNYEDTISRYKIGRNGYGVKLTNIFSVIFQVIIGDPVNKLQYTQTWTDAMTKISEPIIEPYDGPGFTQITFAPDFNYFYESNIATKAFLSSMEGFYLNRTMEMSYAAQVITYFNGIELDYRNAVTFFNAHFEGLDTARRQIHWVSPDKRQEFVIADTPGKGFAHAFVNGTPVHQGQHVNEYLKAVFEDIISEFKDKHGKKVSVLHLKKHVSILLRVTLDKPVFDSQIKKMLMKPTPKPQIGKKIQREIRKWDTEEELKKFFNMKSKVKEDHRDKPKRIAKVTHAIQSGSSNFQERLKCTLILTEGETGKTLAMKGFKHLPGGMQYNGIYPLRGKPMNIERHTEEKISANNELSDILNILNADVDIDYYKNPQECQKLRYGKIGLMMDADYDGYHIDGLLIKFIYSRLRSLAPFEFVVIIMTPVIEGFKAGQRLAFYHQKQHAKWMRQNDPHGWEFKYRKGLGSWDTDPKTLKALFEKPVIVTLEIDSTTDDILTLAFNKKFAAERRQWIAAYDPNSEVVIRTPRPVTDFFMEEFRDYSKASVIRAIPRLMDGMKPVHRKILYAMFKKFPKSDKKHKTIKIPQFGGFVMEKSGYHHGEQALYTTIIGMGQRYITGPNNIPVVESEGNFGDRRMRGDDKSPARYLFCRLAPITRYIYRQEDEPLWEILYDDGDPVEPKEMYPVIPMALVNKCEGISTGWSTKIPCHDPRVVLEWVRQWVEEKKAKRHIPKEELSINVADKPELKPWWRQYTGNLIRIKNHPFEAYRNEGRFDYQHHTIFIREIPAEVSIERYKNWGEKIEDLYHEKPEEALFRSFLMCTEPPNIDFRINGLSTPTLAKLNLVRTITLSNLVLIGKDDVPKKYAYTYEIVCEWCYDRLEIYERRKAYLIGDKEDELKRITLKYMFIMDVVEGRLELRNRPRSEIIPYMKAKGYPYGSSKKKSKNPHEKKESNFLAIPIGTITREKSEKLRQKLGAVQAELDYYRNVLPEDLWLKDLEELRIQIDKMYQTPLY